MRFENKIMFRSSGDTLKARGRNEKRDKNGNSHSRSKSRSKSIQMVHLF